MSSLYDDRKDPPMISKFSSRIIRKHYTRTLYSFLYPLVTQLQIYFVATIMYVEKRASDVFENQTRVSNRLRCTIFRTLITES